MGLASRSRPRLASVVRPRLRVSTLAQAAVRVISGTRSANDPKRALKDGSRLCRYSSDRVPLRVSKSSGVRRMNLESLDQSVRTPWQRFSLIFAMFSNSIRSMEYEVRAFLIRGPKTTNTRSGSIADLLPHCSQEAAFEDKAAARP